MTGLADRSEWASVEGTLIELRARVDVVAYRSWYYPASILAALAQGVRCKLDSSCGLPAGCLVKSAVGLCCGAALCAAAQLLNPRIGEHTIAICTYGQPQMNNAVVNWQRGGKGRPPGCRPDTACTPNLDAYGTPSQMQRKFPELA